MAQALGYLSPPDREHENKYPLMGLAVPPPVPPAGTSRVLNPVLARTAYNQGQLNACVGASCSRLCTIDNSVPGKAREYDWQWLWQQAKARDGFPNPTTNRGTTVRAALEVLKTSGPRRRNAKAPSAADGIVEFRWCKQVDEMRAAIYAGLPIVIGIGWFQAFDHPADGHGLPHPPQAPVTDYVIGRGGRETWGDVEGGHALCIWGYSDANHGFRFCNTWGSGYPLAWLDYDMMAWQLERGAEAGVVTDKPGPK